MKLHMTESIETLFLVEGDRRRRAFHDVGKTGGSGERDSRLFGWDRSV